MKKNKLLALCVFVSFNLFTSIGLAFVFPDIINGKPVQPGEIYSKYTVGLGDEELFCSGVIISDHHILTAAHCQDGLLKGKIYFGTNKSNFEYRNIRAITVHPDYCKQNNCGTEYSKDDHDILVVELIGDLPQGYKPITIAAQSELQPGSKIFLAGFGADELGKYEDILKVTEVPMDQFNGQSEFRTIETAAGSCSGDSGGPAFIRKDQQLYLAGLTSRGDGPCRSFGIYTLVDYFSDWILEIITKPSHD